MGNGDANQSVPDGTARGYDAGGNRTAVATFRTAACAGARGAAHDRRFQDALACLQNHRFAKDPYGRRLFDEAEQWFLAEETDWPYSFESICGILELDPSAVRQHLRVPGQGTGIAGRARRRPSAARAPHASRARGDAAYLIVGERRTQCFRLA